MKIFVSIASYQDPILRYTIQSAIENAKYKDSLVLGVFDQSLEHLDVPSNVRYKTCDPKDAKGCCWARSTIQEELFDGEDIFMQVDSHTMFEKDWDNTLLEHYESVLNWFDKPIITGYPRAFDVITSQGGFINTKEKYIFRKPFEQKDETHVMTVHEPYQIGYHSGQVTKNLPPKVYRGFGLSAGFIFTEGSWVKTVPYDPEIYFSGEETTLALRSFTHGYDMIHVPNTPLYHWYNSDNQELKRDLHWEDPDANSNALGDKGRSRVDTVLQGKDLGTYGIGSNRTLKEYASLSGLDYEEKTVNLDKTLFKTYENSGIELQEDFE